MMMRQYVQDEIAYDVSIEVLVLSLTICVDIPIITSQRLNRFHWFPHVAILLSQKYPQYNIVVYDKLD